MELIITRRWYTEESTIGDLTIGGAHECYTLEDRVRARKVYGRTAIPAGRYVVTVSRSNRFRRDLPEILDVPGFTGVRIHPGNTSTDTEGCILVGAFRADDRLGNSRVAFDKLFTKIDRAVNDGERCFIQIVDDKDQYGKFTEAA